MIYLIKPSNYDEDGYVIRYWRGVLPSNTLACLYGLTEDVRERGVLGRALQWRIELIDETVQRVDLRAILRRSRMPNTQVLVCLVGVQSNQFARASDLALAFRAGGAAVLIGGFHISGSLAMLPQVPREIQTLLDAGVTVVAGEIEGRWEFILRDALSKQLRPLYNFLPQPPALQAAPMPRISDHYLRRFMVRHFGTLDCGRGCPFSCSFCTVINVQGRAMRFRDVGRLMELVRENYRRHRVAYYFFTDDNFCRNKHWETIFDGLIRLRAEEGIRIAFMLQVDTQSYKLPHFIAKAKAAGCSQVFIGLESLNPQNLEAAGKRQNRVAEFQQLIAAYRQGGIVTHVAYIIGFPFDTPASVRQDVACLQRDLGPEQASFFMLTPLPGSQDHLALLKAGAYLDPDLNRYDSFHAATHHPRMTDEEWRGVYEEAWSSFYGLENMKAILRRVPATNYWGVFMLFLWYKNATMVERGHPMVHGFLRLKGRLQRRPGWPVETRWQYLARRAGDVRRTLRGWTAMALEMEELWLQTRSRSPLEQRVVETLQRRHAHVQQWRSLRLADLQRAYARAAILLGKMNPRHAAWPRVALPSRAWLWVKQRNPFSHSLTYSRRSFQQFWRDTWAYFRRGHWHRIDVTRLAVNLAQECSLFAAFIAAFCRQLVPHLFGGLSASRNLS
ncbi:MAG: radical SAM protein [Candidatus Omnitrophica bacterium]|nr:radical SAM protein [Candidatus Omnitrophota bacterium]